MFGRIAVAVAAVSILTACAASSPPAERAPPPPNFTAPDPAPQQGANAAPPAVVAQADPAPAQRSSGGGGDGGDIVVPGQVERQVPAPAGDPRTASERMEDIRNWDQCVLGAQDAREADPLRPSLDDPEQMCRQQLGMTSRTAVPNSRLQRR